MPASGGSRFEVAWQLGLGRKPGEIRSEIMRTMRHKGETDPTKNWRKSVERVFGKEWVKSQLEMAREIGRCEARGMNLEEIMAESGHQHELFGAWIRVPRDLAPLVQARVSVMGKRRMP